MAGSMEEAREVHIWLVAFTGSDSRGGGGGGGAAVGIGVIDPCYAGVERVSCIATRGRIHPTGVSK